VLVRLNKLLVVVEWGIHGRPIDFENLAQQLAVTPPGMVWISPVVSELRPVSAAHP
jgi:hypothetical protein